ncbi:protein kinase [Streptomyces sp. NPDC093591]|uniref:serine/threonine-protein kinase n=1 Tax=Streptomyces sp. NPDC093591 TaxID=3366044 RepID=UPI003814E196
MGNTRSGGVPGLLVTGRYRLVESIGQGGMGRVWRAVDEILDRLVAVKEMRIDGLDPEDTRTRRERTLREARATARIDHPNVVRVYDVVDEGERLWIVMELVAGRSLERIMAEEGPLGPCAAARIGLGLVAALRQVHARGVLHRDIKPGNVLVEPEAVSGRGRVVLTDFGIAAIQDAKALTMVGMLVGSPDYMAPERISGRPQGPPSDVWSLGATLSAALAGRSPFSRDTTLATLHAVLYEEPELPATAGPLRDILAALLEKEPSIRPGLDDLETALQPVAFPAPTPTMRVVGGGAPAAAAGRSGTEPAGSASGTAPEPEATAAAAPEVGPVGGQLYGQLNGPAGGLVAAQGAERAPESESLAWSEPHPGSEPEPHPGPEPIRRADPAPRPQPETTRRPDPNGSPQPAPEPRTARTPDPEPPPDPVTPATPRPPTSTPASLEASRACAPPDPRQPAAVHDAIPPQPSTVTEGAGSPRTDLGGESGGGVGEAEVRSPVPTGTPKGAGPRRAGVSLSRAEAVTERRPAPEPELVPGAAGSAHAMPPGELPGPAAPARPRPRSRRGRRRTGLIAAAGIAVAGAAVAVILAANSDPPKDNQAGSATPTTSSPGGTRSSTVEGTSRPQSLPPGARREAGGFAWVTPEGWRRDVKTGSEVHYTSPDAKQELAGKSSLARDDLMDSWSKSEENAQQGQYRKIRLERTTFRGHPAVVWEYTFTLQGAPWHARLLGFTVDGKSYQINTWYQPDIEAQALRTYEKVRDSFTVL